LFFSEHISVNTAELNVLQVRKQRTESLNAVSTVFLYLDEKPPFLTNFFLACRHNLTRLIR